MIINYIGITVILSLITLNCTAQERFGAVVPWTTFEAEKMKTDGIILGPKYDPYQVETESSGQKCVKLISKGQSVEFKATIAATSMIIRYSLPDRKEGNGLSATLGIYKNSKLLHYYQITSHFSWLYGKYPFVNDPAGGVPRNFYDEIRIKDVQFRKGDIIRIQWNNQQEDKAGYCIIDLVDLENIPRPVKAPLNSLSVTDKIFTGDKFCVNYTDAFRKCIASAAATGKSVYIPAGNFKITGDLDIPANVTIQGAGMWYSTLTGDEAQYADVTKRVRIKGNGSNIHLAGFAVIGRLNYRSDKEPNDGIVGSYGTNSTITGLWIEHTKVGMWIENSYNLHISGCRMRNTLADGINFCVGMAHSTIENCTARGTGDDCFAIWPAAFMPQQFSPGHNVITHCTAQLPFLANGSAIYGGESNEIRNCAFKDITAGSAVLISTTFPTGNEKVNNNFSGKTIIADCFLSTSGGFDHEWDWRAALEICIDKRSISGVIINDLTINNSLSNGIGIIEKYASGVKISLSDATLENVHINNYSIGINGMHGLFINNKAEGSLTVKTSFIYDIDDESKTFTVSK